MTDPHMWLPERSSALPIRSMAADSGCDRSGTSCGLATRSNLQKRRRPSAVVASQNYSSPPRQLRNRYFDLRTRIGRDEAARSIQSRLTRVEAWFVPQTQGFLLHL